MNILENRIKKNKESFDVHEPKDGHLGRFSSKLKEMDEADDTNTKNILIRNKSLIRVAAIFISLIAISGLILLLLPKEQNGAYAAELPEELQEVKMHYDFQTKEKLDRLNQCTIDENQAELVRNIAQEELDKLDQQSDQLIEEYQKNPGNEKVEQALIKNFKSKSDIIDNIVQRICEL